MRGHLGIPFVILLVAEIARRARRAVRRPLRALVGLSPNDSATEIANGLHVHS